MSRSQNILPKSPSKKTWWCPECSLSTQITQQGFDAERRDLLKCFIYFSYAFGLFYMICVCSIKLWVHLMNSFIISVFLQVPCRFVPMDFTIEGIWEGLLKKYAARSRSDNWNSTGNPPSKPFRLCCWHPLLRGAKHHTEGGQESFQKQGKCGSPAKQLKKLLANLWLPGLMEVWSLTGAMNGQPACSQCVVVIPKQAGICSHSQQSKHHLPHQIIAWCGGGMENWMCRGRTFVM